MTSTGIPVLDLRRFASPHPEEVAAVARELDDICREIGFLVIRNHGVDEGIQDALYRAARSFFDLPLEAKMTVRRPRHDQNRGYIPYGEETLARMHGGDTPPDFKEVRSSPSGPSTGRTTGIIRRSSPIRTSRRICGRPRFRPSSRS